MHWKRDSSISELLKNGCSVSRKDMKSIKTKAEMMSALKWLGRALHGKTYQSKQ